ncbi:MAG: hypothetical protein M0C28_20940 [Candidatus Moduliflexus flocculans]|nr:hypothetical protein [Candidatus Moduliflexus flocculans]
MTQPCILTLEKDGVRRQALWKDVLGERVGGFKETWKGEIAAYRLSRASGPAHGPGDGRARVRGQPGIGPDLDGVLEHDGRRCVKKKLNPPGIKANVFLPAAVPPAGLRQPHLQRGPPPEELPHHGGLADDPHRPLPDVPDDEEVHDPADLRREVQGRPDLHHGRRCPGPTSRP